MISNFLMMLILVNFILIWFLWSTLTLIITIDTEKRWKWLNKSITKIKNSKPLLQSASTSFSTHNFELPVSLKAQIYSSKSLNYIKLNWKFHKFSLNWVKKFIENFYWNFGWPKIWYIFETNNQFKFYIIIISNNSVKFITNLF